MVRPRVTDLLTAGIDIPNFLPNNDGIGSGHGKRSNIRTELPEKSVFIAYIVFSGPEESLM